MAVLIYDGECTMCNGFIRFVVNASDNPGLRITDFHSSWTQQNVERDPAIDSMIFLHDGKEFIYSDAVIELLAVANKRFRPLRLLKLIPRFFRDSVYQVVARNRRKLFAGTECPLPTPKAKKLFLP